MAKKNIYLWVAASGLALASAGAWWYQHRSPAPQPGAPAEGAAARPAGPGGPGAQGGQGQGQGGPASVEVAKVRTQPLQDDAQAVGSLKSRQSVTLRPEVAGRIAQIGFAEGSHVRKGQLLVQLDDVLQKAELSQAQAQLSIARANLKRNEELVAQSFVAQRVLDESRAALQVADAQVALAQARLSRMRIVAPFDGTVGLRNINLGDYVKDGADLVNLEDTSQLTVDFRLPERYQSRLSTGQAVQVQLDALPGKKYSAKVQAVDPLLDANGRSIGVRAALPPSAGSELRPGMFARVTTVFSINDAALVVPEEALVPQGGKQFVVKLDKQGEGDGAKLVSRRAEVQLGVRRGPMVQILSGVEDGETVVIAGQQRLQKDGTPVRVVDLAKAGGGGGKQGGGQPGPKPEGAPSSPAAPAGPGAGGASGNKPAAG
ncbi:efflux RND transporter periplasmic adaptor subunit [Hydrogenophaga sp. MI9]|uniref:efflux RND transporter periplasmic adaptor subunit n=1 Tax=Hydrogenophaga sp. MI9 TaxID=3453719 RepID=UPI003EEF4B54